LAIATNSPFVAIFGLRTGAGYAATAIALGRENLYYPEISANQRFVRPAWHGFSAGAADTSRW
jgi:hypothetical protein